MARNFEHCALEHIWQPVGRRSDTKTSTVFHSEMGHILCATSHFHFAWETSLMMTSCTTKGKFPDVSQSQFRERISHEIMVGH